MIFHDRTDAAQRLAKKLRSYRVRADTLVLSIPRGGVVTGKVLAEGLGLEHDVVLVKKVGHPHNPEYAVGAVSLAGHVLDTSIPGVSEEGLRIEIMRILETLRSRSQLFRGNRPPPKLQGRNVILADDGVATGHTMLAAIDLVRLGGASRVLVAVPVASSEAVRRLKGRADEVVVLQEPADFRSVGQFYETFDQVDDEAVARILRESGLDAPGSG